MTIENSQLHVTTCANVKSRSAISHALQALEFVTFELNGSMIFDKASFLSQAAADLPNASDIIGQNNWDAFTDGLWGGLADMSESTPSDVAIVWVAADRLLNENLQDFLIAVSCLEEVSRGVADTHHGFPRPMRMVTVLLGEGENFPRFSGNDGTTHFAGTVPDEKVPISILKNP